MNSTLLLLLASLGSGQLLANGPGLTAETYSAEELFQPIGRFDSSKPGARGHAAMGMYHGYLAGVEARDSGEGDGAIAFFDISDSRNPKRVATYTDSKTEVLFEGHNYGFATVEGREVVCMIAQKGLQLWDWSQITEPRHISSIDLPQLTKGAYANTAWWIAMQYPYAYVGATNLGVYIIDLSELSEPKIVKRLSADQVGGFKVGSLYACGNLLVCNSFDGPGISLLNISKPADPKLLKVVDEEFGYSGVFNGGYFYGIAEVPLIWDVRDPMNASKVSEYDGPQLGSKGGYGMIQDDFLHMGTSSGYAKVNIADPYQPRLEELVTLKIPKQDFDGAHVVGNLAVMTCDHGTGSYLVPHQSNPDTNPPLVNYISPSNGATGVALTSRVGMTFTDEIDHSYLNGVRVQELGGQVLKGHWSVHNAILNFFPSQPLQPGTTYEVILPEGVLRDQMGNAMKENYRSTFSTGDRISEWKFEIVSGGAVESGVEIEFKAQGNQLTSPIIWDFGDGHSGKGKEVKHTYSKPGRYIVTARVKEKGSLAGAILHQVVYAKKSKNLASNSSTIGYDKKDQQLWVVNADNGSVSVLSMKNFSLLREIKLGGKPRSLFLNGDNCYIVDQASSEIVVIQVDNFQEIERLALPRGASPYGIVVNQAASKAWVSCEDIGRVYEVDLSRGSYELIIEEGSSFRGLALNGEETRLYASQFISSDSSGLLYEVNLETYGTRLISLAISEERDTEDSGRGLPNYLSQVVISPDGKTAWIPSKKDNIQRGLVRDGKELTFENTVRTIVSAVDLNTGQERSDLRCDFNDKEMATAATFSPLGDLLFVACQGSNSVEVVDVFSGQHVTSILHVGSAPQGLTIDAAGHLYVHNFLGRSVSKFDIGEILEHGTGYAMPLGSVATVTNEALEADVLRGKKIFYYAADPRMSLDGYVSCASCHLDGGHDGRVWDFSDRGEGLRNTISLKGKAGLQHGRLHWSANFDEVQDFERVIRDRQGGSGFLQGKVYHSPLSVKLEGASQELDDLAAFVSSLDSVGNSPHRNRDGSLTEAGAKGRVIFAEQGCADCHGGGEFTDSSSGRVHDIGTMSNDSGGRLDAKLVGIDSPTLKGLWNTAPYFHDGRSKSLSDVLRDPESEELHGKLNNLSEIELNSLEAYLLQIDDSEKLVADFKPIDEKDTIQLSARELAGKIYEADSKVTAIPPITTILDREVSQAEGYDIQASLNVMMEKRYGEVSGYKLAYASEESQKAWAMDGPASGPFFKGRQVKDKGTVMADTFIGFHIESEIAFTLKSDVVKPVKNITSSMRYIQSVHVGLDVPDLRFDTSKGKVTPGDVIAMGCGAHTYVIGAGVNPKKVDFTGMTVSMDREGKEVYTGLSSSTMGDPREAFRSLANSLIERGTPLRKGQVVLLGSVAKAYVPNEKADAKAIYIGKATGLPPVTLEVR